ncbi:MAG: hypothetical protein ACK4F5_04815 [Aliihoeflea sp.]
MSVVITPFLRKALLLDAAVSAAVGIVLLAATDYLAELLALPAVLLFWAGVIIFVWVAMLVVASMRAVLPQIVALNFVAGNAIWTVASFAIMLAGLIQPNALGIAFVSAQALAVGLFAVLQWIGSRERAIVQA